MLGGTEPGDSKHEITVGSIDMDIDGLDAADMRVITAAELRTARGSGDTGLVSEEQGRLEGLVIKSQMVEFGYEIGVHLQ